jgi:hypothetical protein
MIPRRLLILVALAAVARAELASADFTGLAATIQPDTTSGGVAVDVIRLYATFDDAGDRAMNAGAHPLESDPTVLDSGGSGFYQVTVFGQHQNVAVGESAVAAVPDLAMDSMLTIGVPQGYTGSPTLPAIVGPFNFGAFNTAGGDGFGDPTVISPDGAWVSAVTDPVTLAKPYPPPSAPPPDGDGVYCRSTLPDGATHGVLIGQFVVAAGNDFSGEIGFINIEEGGQNRTVTNTAFSFPGCPTDLSGNCATGFDDVLLIIAAWGSCGATCREDLNGNGSVDFADVLVAIGAWGLCFPPSGACCLTVGSCVEMTESACAGIDGVYQGDGIVCGEVICPLPPWPPGDCGIVPATPDCDDEITVTLGGTWGNSCVPNGSEVTVTGTTILMDVHASYPPGTNCPAVITPWSRSEVVGPLAPGTYSVLAAIFFDGIPFSQYTLWCEFTVDPCP